MKYKSVFLFLGLFFYTSAFAQDMIVKKDFSVIKSKVIEVSSSIVKYKKYSNLEGPLYSIETKEIVAINYENGDKDIFESNQVPIKNEIKNEPKMAIPDIKNDSLIALYNKHITYINKKNKKSNKTVYGGTYKFGMSSSSVLSTNELEIDILLWAKGSWYNAPYVISLRNKTDDFIYIDLARCFKIYPDGKSECYYNNKQTTISSGNGVGASVGLGAVANAVGIGGIVGSIANGISVGGGNSSSSSASYTMQRFLTIPPKSSVNLTEYKGEGQGRNYKVITNSEVFNIEQRYTWIKEGDLYKYGVINYSETESPYKQKFALSYSTDTEFNNLQIISFEIFVQQIFGVSIESNYDYMYYKLGWENMWKGLDKHTLMGTTILFWKDESKVKVE